MEFYEYLGNEIREARKLKKVTQQKLKDLTNLSQATISQMENGIFKLNFFNFCKICSYLDIQPEEILAKMIKNTCFLYYDANIRKIKNYDITHFIAFDSQEKRLGAFLKYLRKN